MYAIIEAGGRQWKVEPGTRLEINRIAAEVGATHTVEQVLLAQDGKQVQVGHPYLAGAKVVCEVLAQPLGPKVISYHYRRRENWRKTVGHRQLLTRLLVKEIQVEGMSSASAPSTAEPVKVLLDIPKPPRAKSSTAAKTPTVKVTAPKVPTAPRHAGGAKAKE